MAGCSVQVDRRGVGVLHASTGGAAGKVVEERVGVEGAIVLFRLRIRWPGLRKKGNLSAIECKAIFITEGSFWLRPNWHKP